MLPNSEPRTIREHFVVPSIRSGKVARAQRSGVRYREGALQPINFGNDPFGVHPPQYLPLRKRGQTGSSAGVFESWCLRLSGRVPFGEHGGSCRRALIGTPSVAAWASECGLPDGGRFLHNPIHWH